MPDRVFISHSSKDRGAAYLLMEAIERRGYPCWISSRDVRGNYQAEIVKAITNCPAMILLFSQNANQSDEILKEISLASKNRKVVIPVRIEDVLPTGAMEYELTTRNWIDFFKNRDKALDRVVEHLEMLTDGPGPTPPPEPQKSFLLAALLAGGGIGAISAAFLGWNYLTSDPALAYAPAPAESSEGRVSGFRADITMGSRAAPREWKRTASDRWSEIYLDQNNATIEHRTIKRMILANCPGTVVSQEGGDRKYAFFPDRGCPDMMFWINHSGGGWGIAAGMTDVR